MFLWEDPDPDHLKGTHTKSISILLLLSGNLKGHMRSVNVWGKLLPKIVVFCNKRKKLY